MLWTSALWLCSDFHAVCSFYSSFVVSSDPPKDMNFIGCYEMEMIDHNGKDHVEGVSM